MKEKNIKNGKRIINHNKNEKESQDFFFCCSKRPPICVKSHNIGRTVGGGSKNTQEKYRKGVVYFENRK